MKKNMVIVFLGIMLLLTSCGNQIVNEVTTDSSDLPMKENVSNEPIKEKNEDIVTTEEVIRLKIAELNKLQEDIKNVNFSHEDRVKKSWEYIECLQGFLEEDFTKLLEDEELTELLGHNVVLKSNVSTDFGIRIVRYDGLPELFGKLERKWTIIQWWNAEGVYVQVLNEKNAENTSEIILLKNNEEDLILLLGGYLTTYNPFPVYVSAWMLEENKWEAINIVEKDKNYEESISVYGNEIVIENISQQSIVINEEINGFNILNDRSELMYKVIFDGETLELILETE